MSSLATLGRRPREAAPFGRTGVRLPLVTGVLLAILFVVFAMERRLGAAHGERVLSVATLIAAGGLSWDLVRDGQPFRVLTAPFLHASMPHLLGNAAAFVLSGWALERIVGRAWMFCIFVLGALAGSAGSLLAASAPSVVSVGASGAIMAMLTALLVISLRLPPSRVRNQVQLRTLVFAVPALLPTHPAAGGVHVDLGAHLGGAALGAVLGVLLLATWERGEAFPSCRRGAALLSALAAASIVCGAAAVSRASGSAWADAPRMIPAERMPHGQDAILAAAAGLLAAYPDDPRAHYLMAVVRLHENDAARAEAGLRETLRLGAASPGLLQPAFERSVRVLLAVTLAAQGERSAAVAMVREDCARADAQALPKEVAMLLARHRLCIARAGP